MRWAFLLAVLFLAGCGDETQDPTYRRGYEAGHHDGWAETCNQIERFSDRIHETLRGFTHRVYSTSGRDEGLID